MENQVLRIALISIAMLLTGCQWIPYSASVIYNRGQRQFPEADRLVFSGFSSDEAEPEGQREITDPAKIARFARIYSNANWEVYWHTLPVNPSKRRIEVYRDGKKIRSMNFFDSLWESADGSGWQVAEVAAADGEWLESLFPHDNSGLPRKILTHD